MSVSYALPAELRASISMPSPAARACSAVTVSLEAST
jgi:hypothetical protein